ncbi:MAG: hypothetical protein AMJ37_01650 [Dehalococcoidia bacterium DG_18]|nr:MAG: hypothetical protein AMJ37_01650 [Dehalococcoidia bacterium DG_18]
MANTSGDTNIWLIIGPVLAALFGAVVGGFIREWWVEKFYGPKLYILNADVVRTAWEDTYRIMVRNEGRRAAENSIGMISLDAEEDDVYEEPAQVTYSTSKPESDLKKDRFHTNR